jgi:hypothetical protein
LICVARFAGMGVASPRERLLFKLVTISKIDTQPAVSWTRARGNICRPGHRLRGRYATLDTSPPTVVRCTQ